MGNYYEPAKYLFSNILKAQIMEAPKITAKTIELGTLYSPEFICTPFKYTLGTLIECLEEGANVLVQFGGGCRYGYYAELQELILKDLNYNFIFINLITAGKANILKIIKDFKKIDKNFNKIKGLYYLFITIKMIKYMDKVDDYIRLNYCFIKEKKKLNKLKNEMLLKFQTVKSPLKLYYYYKRYFSKIKKLKKVFNKHLKIAIIGELYTIMEPFANYQLEEKLIKNGISLKRFTNVYYLLFEKKKLLKTHLKKIKKYVKYKLGADATDNIAWTLQLCSNNIDGIIHIKSTFCTPEIGAMPIISKICSEYEVPLLFFSFDMNTSPTGFETRIEAFQDMIWRRKNESLFRN